MSAETVKGLKAGRIWFLESSEGRDPADCFFFGKGLEGIKEKGRAKKRQREGRKK